jgi:septal ring factor EnvC (AmiA/AmiB activator)
VAPPRDIPLAGAILDPAQDPPPPVLPALIAPDVLPAWASVPFEVTLRRVEDQRTELDRLQRELDQRGPELIQLREELARSKHLDADNAQLRAQVSGLERKLALESMAVSTLRKDLGRGEEELVQLRRLSRRQAAELVTALKKVGDLSSRAVRVAPPN